MLTVDEIFADDLKRPVADRSFPWEECRSGMRVVVEPKPHWARDLRVYRLTECWYCYFQDWQENGVAAQFFEHPETCGDHVLMSARALIVRELADGLWTE